MGVRTFLGRLYVGVWLFRTKALVGGLALRFFRLIYPRLTVGARPRVWGLCKVMMFGDGRIDIGDDLHMVSSSSRSAITLFTRCGFTVFPGGEILIGHKVALNGTTITSKKRVRIGDGTMVAPNVIIVDSDFHAQWPPDARLYSATDEIDREVVIGRNVWIGMNSVILKGASIGDNTIIGAASLVSGVIPSNVLAAGNPAKVLRQLDAGLASET